MKSNSISPEIIVSFIILIFIIIGLFTISPRNRNNIAFSNSNIQLEKQNDGVITSNKMNNIIYIAGKISESKQIFLFDSGWSGEIENQNNRDIFIKTSIAVVDEAEKAAMFDVDKTNKIIKIAGKMIESRQIEICNIKYVLNKDIKTLIQTSVTIIDAFEKESVR